MAVTAHGLQAELVMPDGRVITARSHASKCRSTASSMAASLLYAAVKRDHLSPTTALESNPDQLAWLLDFPGVHPP
jgi:uncharacterized protein YcbX